MAHQVSLYNNTLADNSFDSYNGSWTHPTTYHEQAPFGQIPPLPIAAEWLNPEGPSPSPSPVSSTYPSSPSASPSPPSSPPASQASRSPSPTSSGWGSPRPRKTVSRRSAKDPFHIPRPRNAFILYRSATCRTINMEHDHRVLSQIISHMWANLPEDEKKEWKDKAALEKAQHAKAYPNYRFRPQQRTSPVKRRKVKRNGEVDKKCFKIAGEMLSRGSDEDTVKAELQKFNSQHGQQAFASPSSSHDDYTTNVFDLNAWHGAMPSLTSPSPSSGESSSDETPFRSPLLPPATPPTPLEPQTHNSVSTPLSPLQFSPQSQLRSSPVAALPEVSNEGGIAASQEYTAGAVVPALGFSAQSTLALSNMYPAGQYGLVPGLTPGGMYQPEMMYKIDDNEFPAYETQPDAQVSYYPEYAATQSTSTFNIDGVQYSVLPAQRQEDYMGFAPSAEYPLAAPTIQPAYSTPTTVENAHGAAWSYVQSAGLEAPMQAEPAQLMGYSLGC